MSNYPFLGLQAFLHNYHYLYITAGIFEIIQKTGIKKSPAKLITGVELLWLKGGMQFYAFLYEKDYTLSRSQRALFRIKSPIFDCSTSG